MARYPDVLPFRPSFSADKWGNKGDAATGGRSIDRWSIKAKNDQFNHGIPSMIRYQDFDGAGLSSGEARVQVTGLYFLTAALRIEVPCTGSLQAIRFFFEVDRQTTTHNGYNIVSRDMRCNYEVSRIS